MIDNRIMKFISKTKKSSKSNDKDNKLALLKFLGDTTYKRFRLL